jgi:hypothetical protein
MLVRVECTTAALRLTRYCTVGVLLFVQSRGILAARRDLYLTEFPIATALRFQFLQQ